MFALFVTQAPPMHRFLMQTVHYRSVIIIIIIKNLNFNKEKKQIQVFKIVTFVGRLH